MPTSTLLYILARPDAQGKADLYICDSSGNFINTGTHGNQREDLDIYKNGTCITTGYYYSSTVGNTSTFDRNGQRLRSIYAGGATMYAIAIDHYDGSFVIGGLRNGDLTTRKYSSQGSLQWSKDHGNTVNGIAVDPVSREIVTVGQQAENIALRVYDKDGLLTRSDDLSGIGYSVEADPRGGLFVVGLNGRLVKLDSSGDTIFDETVTGTPTVHNVAINPSDYSIAVASSYGAHKYTSGGVHEWSVQWSNANLRMHVHDTTVDPEDGAIYVVGSKSSLHNLAKIDPTDGSIIWATLLVKSGESELGFTFGGIQALSPSPYIAPITPTTTNISSNSSDVSWTWEPF